MSPSDSTTSSNKKRKTAPTVAGPPSSNGDVNDNDDLPLDSNDPTQPGGADGTGPGGVNEPGITLSESRRRARVLRNRQSAQRSRDAKKNHQLHLEIRVKELEALLEKATGEPVPPMPSSAAIPSSSTTTTATTSPSTTISTATSIAPESTSTVASLPASYDPMAGIERRRVLERENAELRGRVGRLEELVRGLVGVMGRLSVQDPNHQNQQQTLLDMPSTYFADAFNEAELGFAANPSPIDVLSSGPASTSTAGVMDAVEEKFQSFSDDKMNLVKPEPIDWSMELASPPACSASHISPPTIYSNLPPDDNADTSLEIVDESCGSPSFSNSMMTGVTGAAPLSPISTASFSFDAFLKSPEVSAVSRLNSPVLARPSSPFMLDTTFGQLPGSVMRPASPPASPIPRPMSFNFDFVPSTKQAQVASPSSMSSTSSATVVADASTEAVKEGQEVTGAIVENTESARLPARKSSPFPQRVVHSVTSLPTLPTSNLLLSTSTTASASNNVMHCIKRPSSPFLMATMTRTPSQQQLHQSAKLLEKVLSTPVADTKPSTSSPSTSNSSHSTTSSSRTNTRAGRVGLGRGSRLMGRMLKTSLTTPPPAPMAKEPIALMA